MYQYDKSKENILSILGSTTKIVNKESIPLTESEFTYENGIIAGVGALFVDIVDSSKLFQFANETTARIIRCFCSEIISILKDNPNYREIGIRGDCVYCIYSATSQEDMVKIFRHAYRINTFIEMLNILLKKKGFSDIHAGIGLGYSKNLIIKAGQYGTGINDRIWIGKAVVDACHLSNIANRNGIEPIAMSPFFCNNVYNHLLEENSQYKEWINTHYAINGVIDYYHCNIVEIGFDQWIKTNC